VAGFPLPQSEPHRVLHPILWQSLSEKKDETQSHCQSFANPDFTMGHRARSPYDLDMLDRSPSRDPQTTRDRATTPAKPNIDCPWFQAALAKRRPRTCRNPVLRNMADLRRHAVRGRQPHMTFLRQCGTCRETFTNREVFESQHGNEGELCVDEALDDDAHSQWTQLYDIASEQLEGMSGTRHLCELHHTRSFNSILICLHSNISHSNKSTA
jgi:hypothetical protein